MAKTNYPLAWILLIILSCVWGASYILIKYAVQIFTPIEVGLLRMSVATIVLLPFMIRDLRTLNWRDFKLLTLVGICGNLSLETGAPVEVDAALGIDLGREQA